MAEIRRDRVQERIDALGVSREQVSKLAFGNRDSVRHILAGRQRDVRSENSRRLAAVLQVSEDYLFGRSDALGEPPTGMSVEPAPAPPLKRGRPPRPIAPIIRGPMEVLPARYAVQAGAWLERDDLAQDQMSGPPVAAAAGFPSEHQWLELVRGDSMDQLYPEGVWVHVVDAVAIGYAPREGDVVVVERSRQQAGLVERSLKQVAHRPGRKAPELWPRSNNPRWNKPLAVGHLRDVDDEIRIAALVIGAYFPARR